MARTKKPTLAEIEAEQAEWQREEQARHADTLAHLREAIIPKLERLGVVKVRLAYSGYGDSGAFDFIDYFNAAGKTIYIGSNGPDLDYEIEIAVEDFLPDGFEINEGGQGSITIDVAKGCLAINHQENVVETTDTTKEFSF